MPIAEDYLSIFSRGMSISGKQTFSIVLNQCCALFHGSQSQPKIAQCMPTVAAWLHVFYSSWFHTGLYSITACCLSNGTMCDVLATRHIDRADNTSDLLTGIIPEQEAYGVQQPADQVTYL